MKNWPKIIRDAVVMGLTWAVQWAVLAVLFGTVTEFLTGYSVEENIVDPLVAPAMPGFFFGVIYSVVLSFAEKDRRFIELPFLRTAAWGAAVGLILGASALTLGSPNGPFLQVAALITCSSTLLSTISAFGSGLLFRFLARQKPQASTQSEG